MRDVYENSACNIAASASIDPTGGLFRSRIPEDILQGWIKVISDGSNEQYYQIIDHDYLNRHVSRTELHKRGWVSQERLLAPRVLHFAEKQIFWECFTDHKCEASPSGLPFEYLLKDFDILFEERPQASKSSSVIRLWNILVQEYSECALTNANDKLGALSGLAKIFQRAPGDQYLAGLWKSHLITSLNWYCGSLCERPLHYRAPSWSWASLDGRVHLRDPDSPNQLFTTVLDVQMNTS